MVINMATPESEEAHSDAKMTTEKCEKIPDQKDKVNVSPEELKRAKPNSSMKMKKSLKATKSSTQLPMILSSISEIRDDEMYINEISDIQDSFRFIEDAIDNENDSIILERSDDDFIKNEETDVIRDILQVPPGERNPEQIDTLKKYFEDCEAITLHYPMLNLEKFCQEVYSVHVEETDSTIFSSGSPVNFWFMVYKGIFKRHCSKKEVEILESGTGLDFKLKDQPQHHLSTVVSSGEDCMYFCLSKETFLTILQEVRFEKLEVDGNVVQINALVTTGDRHCNLIVGATKELTFELIKQEQEFAQLIFSILPYLYNIDRREFYSYITKLLDDNKFRKILIGNVTLWLQHNYRSLIQEESFVEFWDNFSLQVLQLEPQLSLMLLRVVIKNSPCTLIKMNRNGARELGFEIVSKCKCLIIDKVDQESYAYACGLREMDELLLIDSIPIKNLPANIAVEILTSLHNYDLVVRRCHFFQKFLKNSDQKLIKNFSAILHPSNLGDDVSIDSPPKEKNKSESKNLFSMIMKPSKKNAKNQSTTSSNSESSNFNQTSDQELIDPIYLLHDRMKLSNFLKVFIDDGNSSVKYVAVHQFTCAKRVVDLLSPEVKFDGSSQSCALFEVSMNASKTLVWRRIRDGMINLLYRIPYNSRYYLKPISRSSKSNPESDFHKESTLNILDLNVDAFARVLTFQDFCYHVSICPMQYLYFTTGKTTEEFIGEIIHLRKRNEMLSNFVISVILRESTYSGRTKLIRFIIFLAESCAKLGGFNAAFTIYAALKDPDIERLENTLARLSHKANAKLQELSQLFSFCSNMANYRNAITKLQKAGLAVIPISSHTLSNILFTYEGIDKKAELINYGQFRKMIYRINDLASHLKLDQEFPKMVLLKKLDFPIALTLQILSDSHLFEHAADELTSGNDVSAEQTASHTSGNSSTISTLVNAIMRSNDKKSYDDVTMLKKCLVYTKEQMKSILFENKEEREAVSRSLETKPVVQQDLTLKQKGRISWISGTDSSTVSPNCLDHLAELNEHGKHNRSRNSNDSQSGSIKSISSLGEINFGVRRDSNSSLSENLQKLSILQETASTDAISPSEVPTQLITHRPQSVNPKKKQRRPFSIAMGTMMLRGLRNKRCSASIEDMMSEDSPEIDKVSTPPTENFPNPDLNSPDLSPGTNVS